MQVEHCQVASAAVGFFIPAAAQLKPPIAGAGAGLDGRGASQIVHFSVALAGFLSMHVEHSHVSPAAVAVGCFMPAAAKLKLVAAFALDGGAANAVRAGSEKSNMGRAEAGAALAESRLF